MAVRAVRLGRRAPRVLAEGLLVRLVVRAPPVRLVRQAPLVRLVLLDQQARQVPQVHQALPVQLVQVEGLLDQPGGLAAQDRWARQGQPEQQEVRARRVQRVARVRPELEQRGRPEVLVRPEGLVQQVELEQPEQLVPRGPVVGP